jgi:hypothetical protein
MQSSIFHQNMSPALTCSLSLQFILYEWMRACELLRHLEVVTPLRLQNKEAKTEFASILKEIEKLFFLSSFQDAGMLDKLCFYCEILLQASPLNGSNIDVILQDIKSLTGKLKFEVLMCQKTDPLPPKICEILSSNYSTLRKKLIVFFKDLFPFLYDMRYDENMLAYLIENRKKLNTILGNRQIEELLSYLFPEGPFFLKKTIEEGYAKRDFYSFFYKIEPFIDQIEWESPCSMMQR